MKYSQYPTLLLLIACAHSIAISVSSQKQRCMIVSSNDHTQLLKVDLKFSQFEGQAIEEGYRVVLHDTETHQQQVFQVQYGTFRKEFPLTENVVYRLCFKIVLTSYRSITKLVDYHVALKHQFNTAQESIKVPENLLRSKDLTQTYQYMDKTKELLKQLNDKGDLMRKQQTQVFDIQKETMSHLEWVSVIELLVIVVFGWYQYSKVKKIIENKRIA